MKKMITNQNGGRIEVETETTLLNFRAGDIVTGEIDWPAWHNRRVRIDGVEADTNLWGTIIGTDRAHFCSARSTGLLLISRPNWPFKVGDRAHITFRKGVNLPGEVVVLDPTTVGVVLVKFDHPPNARLEPLRDYYDRPWFPEKYKNTTLPLTWVKIEDLRLIVPDKPPEQFQTVINANGEPNQIDTHGMRHGFRAGDSIFYPAANSQFATKRFIGLGIHTARRNQFAVRSSDSQQVHKLDALESDSPSPNSVILISRPGAKFKVGDNVNIALGNSRLCGIIRALDPLATETMKYVITTIPVAIDTSSKQPDQNSFWFPEELKSTFVVLRAENELSPVNAPDQPAPAANVQPNAEPKDDAEAVLRQSIRMTIRRDWQSLKGWMAKGELPVFDPRLPDPDGDVMYFGKAAPAPNLPECLRKFGAAFFHQITGESEFNRERYEADPQESYGALMPADERGELIRYLLFGQPKTIEEVEEKFPWLKKAQTENPVEVKEQTKIDEAEKPPVNVLQSAMAKLVKAGLDDEMATMILKDPELAGRIISLIKRTKFPR